MKYQITSREQVLANGAIVHQIKAIKTFSLKDGGKVEKGTYGGWVENENNLSQSGYSWIFRDSIVHGNATVKDDAIISTFGRISGNASISGSAVIDAGASVYDDATVTGNAIITYNADISGHATVGGSAEVSGTVSDFATISGKAWIKGKVCDHALVVGNIVVDTFSTVRENTVLDGNILLKNSTISIASNENLLRNYFNTNPIACEISDTDVCTTEEITISPVNFPSNKEAVYLTKTPKVFSLKRLNTDSKIANSPISLLEQIWLSVEKNFATIQKAYHNLSFFIKALKDFILEDETFYKNLDIWVDNFVSKIETTTHYDKTSYDVIKRNKSKISLLAKQYLFSQFLGIFMWIEEPNHESSWINFLKSLSNCCNMDFYNKTIYSLDPEVFVWNKELIFMVQEICNFSDKWREKQCELFEDLNSSLELY